MPIEVTDLSRFPEPDRTTDGMRTVVSLLGVLNRNDARTAQHIINTCDPAPALFAMAALVLSLTDQAGESVPELLETLRRQVLGAGESGDNTDA